jgi:undecaprenyl diphosphate synthase
MIAVDIESGDLAPHEISDASISSRLATAGTPDPDLLIRTGGEVRISNFLLWQLAYTELVFSPLFWPAFRREALYDAIRSFQERDRRFGRVAE